MAAAASNNKVEENGVYIPHVVAVPYPGRGHINPLMNLCKSLSSSNKSNILITFVITEEWLGFIGSEPKPPNIRFATIPNVLPSELVRAADMVTFVRAVQTEMAYPFEKLLDGCSTPVEFPPATIIIADTFLKWAVEVGNRRNIPVASFWTMSATVFSVLHHFDLLVRNGHFPFELSERGDERVDYIPGISSIRLADLPTILHTSDNRLIQLALEPISFVRKAQYLLFTSIYELESQVVDHLKREFPFPVYSLGPVIPYSDLLNGSDDDDSQCMDWLNNQPQSSVLYVSLGSFLSVPITELDEIAAGLHDSGVRYLWVARGETSRFREKCGGGSDGGLIVPWCEQLKVLHHPAVGGFWTHCGWNSTLEGVYAGVPMLMLPILMDQVTDSKFIVEDWKIGWEVKRGARNNGAMRREYVAELVRRFMDPKSEERKEMLKRAEQLQLRSKRAISRGGSSDTSLKNFLLNILNS